MILTNLLQKRNTRRKISLLSEYFSSRRKETILDFGCGDLSMSISLSNSFPNLEITGVDVVDFSPSKTRVKFVKYDGKEIPFKNKSFDTVISYHVLHHTDNPAYYFRECVRVAKKRILLVEPIPRVSFELPFMKIMDWIFNVWKSHSIDMPFHFLSEKELRLLFKKEKLTLVSKKDVEILPPFSPTGRSYLFELTR